MGRPVLLWLDLSVRERMESPPEILSRYCEIRCASDTELPPPAELGGRPQLICFNFDYPDLPGLQLLANTKKRYSSVPVLMLTLHHSEELAVWAFRTQVFDYFVKPLRIREVDRCMKRLAEIFRVRETQQRRHTEPSVSPPPPDVRYQSLSPAQTRLKPALTYIYKHINEVIRESDVAAVCGMSPYHFSRAFKAAFGSTFQNHLIDYRITEAKRRLANPRMSIIDVGMSVGFNDPSYFARTFKRRTGVSPTAYRSGLAAQVPQGTEQLPLWQTIPSD